MAIRFVILDFDGTCTQVDKVQAQFLDEYAKAIRPAFVDLKDNAWKKAWGAALAEVRKQSPRAYWSFGGAASAPAAADPYILSGEAASYLVRQQDPDGRKKLSVPNGYAPAYAKHPAPWRPEIREVLEALVDDGITVGFISNSDTDGLKTRLTDRLAEQPKLRKKLLVQGNAAKYVVQELPFDLAGPAARHRKIFEALPAAVAVKDLPRRVYLRRGRYFEALCNFWKQLGLGPSAAAETLVCGDVWELDLALPAALGAQVHLITRAAPYRTYPYELALAGSENVSDDLHGLVEHVRRINGPRAAKAAGQRVREPHLRVAAS